MSILKGTIAELEFATRATKHGLIVGYPFIETDYDWLVDSGKRIYRVQVKSNHTSKDEKTGGYGIGLKSNSGSYSPENVDIVACYVLELNMWYLFPIHEVFEKTKITVFPHSVDSKWNKYRESWGLILN